MCPRFESSEFSLSPREDDGLDDEVEDDADLEDDDLEDDDELDDDEFDEEFEDELIDLDDEYDKHGDPDQDGPQRPRREDY